MKRYLPTDPAARKRIPIASGVVDYFPDALAAVAEVSFKGNEQHNPGQPLHWAQEKSTDFADTIMRHLIERGTMDTDGLRHSAKLAWRALANLQMELQKELNLSLPRNATYNGVKPDDESRSNQVPSTPRQTLKIAVLSTDSDGAGLGASPAAPQPVAGIPESTEQQLAGDFHPGEYVIVGSGVPS